MHETRIVEDPIAQYIETELNGYVIQFHGGTFQKRGVPDIVASIDGVFYGIECKREKNAYLMPQQKKHLIQIAEDGGVAMVVRSLEEFKEMYFDKESYIIPTSSVKIYSDTQYYGIFKKG